MDELIKLLSELITTGKLNTAEGCGDMKFEQDENGDLVIRYSKRKENNKVLEFKKELDEMDDELFIETVKLIKEHYPKTFELLSDLPLDIDDETFLGARDTFNKCKIMVATNLIKQNKKKMAEIQMEIEERKKIMLELAEKNKAMNTLFA